MATVDVPGSDYPDAWASAKSLGWTALEKAKQVASYARDCTTGQLKSYRADIEDIQRVYTNFTHKQPVTMVNLRDCLKKLKAVVLKTLLISIALTAVACQVLNVVRGLPIIGSVARAAQIANIVGLGVLMVELRAAALAIGEGRYEVYKYSRAGEGENADSRLIADVVDKMVEVYQNRSLFLAVFSDKVGGALDEIRGVVGGDGAVDTPHLNSFGWVFQVIDTISSWFSVRVGTEN